MDRVPFTKQGLEKVRSQLRRLQQVERPENIRAIEEARGHGDISENAEYHAAKERQAFLDGKINELKSVLGKAEVIDIAGEPGERVVFGRTVVLYSIGADDEVTYQLVGPYESDPEKGRISVTSPLGQSLIGREVGDEVRAKTPGGIQEFEILEIS
jgi:transcription elongation factor GreA